MIKKKVTYKEPAEYFTPEMRKIAEEWDREHSAEKERQGKSANGGWPFSIIQFIDCSDHLYDTMVNFLIIKGYRKIEGNKQSDLYFKENHQVEIKITDNAMGYHMWIKFQNIDDKDIMQNLNACPDCGSSHLQFFVPYGIAQTNKFKYSRENELLSDYGAFDGPAFPPTRRCTDCGCTWHSSADIRYLQKYLNSDSMVEDDFVDGLKQRD